MSSGAGNSMMRFFRGSRALFSPVKSAAATSSTTATKTEAKPKSKGRSTGSTTSTTSASTVPKPKRDPTRPTGILKVIPVSPALRSFLGVPEASRTGAVKQIWSYVKLHNLQNPADKREIYCDERLKSIFEGRDKVNFLEIGKLLSSHFVKAS